MTVKPGLLCMLGFIPRGSQCTGSATRISDSMKPKRAGVWNLGRMNKGCAVCDLSMGHLPKIKALLLGGILVTIPIAKEACADSVVLSTGRSMDGIILEETADRVMLDIGMGSVTFTKDKVVHMVRSSRNENRKREHEWKLKYISADDLPEDLQALWRQWDRLQAQRSHALAAAKTLPEKVNQYAHLEKSLQATRNEYGVVSQQIAKRTMKQDVATYNLLVERNNAFVAQNAKTQRSLHENQKQRGQMREQIATYARSLTRFEVAFEPLKHTYEGTSNDEVPGAWIARVSSSLLSFQQDFVRMSAPLSCGPRGTVVQVRINGKQPGSFILDTGASIVTLSEAFARRHAVEYDPRNELRLRLADGQMSKGYPVVLKTVEVGDALARNVAAAVLPTAPGPGVDGLLGMTFLDQFEVQIDAGRARIELKKLLPR